MYHISIPKLSARCVVVPFFDVSPLGSASSNPHHPEELVNICSHSFIRKDNLPPTLTIRAVSCQTTEYDEDVVNV